MIFMKKKYLILFLVFSLSLRIKAQNAISYYNEINKAEIAISNSLFGKAIKHYEVAFSLKNTPFIKDIKNANLCALKINDYSNSFIFLEHLIKMGFSLECFNAKDYDSIKNTHYWDKLKLVISESKIKRNQSLTNELKKRYFKEQNLSRQKNIDTIYYKRYVECVIENYERIRDIVKTYGFINESFHDREHCTDFSYTYFTFLHYYQLINLKSKLSKKKIKKFRFLINYNFNYNEIHQMLFNAVVQGKFLPSTFASLEDIIDPNNYGTLNFIQVNDTCGYVKYKEQNQIDYRRGLIGLCSIAESKEILNFKLKMNNKCPYPPYDKEEQKSCIYKQKSYEEFDLRSAKHQVFYFKKHSEGKEFFKSIVNK
ncbi:MAG: hypothetical protein MI739_04745 [Bacteroidales bacterium]|nr:hypothetical protein [Bacteroidales bacterium]